MSKSERHCTRCAIGQNHGNNRRRKKCADRFNELHNAAHSPSPGRPLLSASLSTSLSTLSSQRGLLRWNHGLFRGDVGVEGGGWRAGERSLAPDPVYCQAKSERQSVYSHFETQEAGHIPYQEGHILSEERRWR